MQLVIFSRKFERAISGMLIFAKENERVISQKYSKTNDSGKSVFENVNFTVEKSNFCKVISKRIQ